MPILPIFLPTFWEPLLLFPLLVLIIPIAILIGQRWRSGPLVSLSAGAIIGMVIYLALLTMTWSAFSPNFNPPFGGYYTEAVMSLIGGAVLLLGASALAFADALRGRRPAWAVIQCALVYGSFVGMLGFFLSPVTYCGELPNGTYCSPFDYGRFAIFAALSLAGPLALLIYALFAAFQRQPRALPDGLTISRPTAGEGGGEQP
jgi:hypothetical protein